VAKQRTNWRNRFQHDIHVNFIAERRAQDRLPQTQPIRTKLAFHLQAMQLQRDFEVGEKVRAVENAVMELHIQKLNGKDVR